MFALVIILLVAQDHNVAEPLSMKYIIQAHQTEAACEEKRVELLTSVPKEWKVTVARTACVRLSPPTTGS